MCEIKDFKAIFSLLYCQCAYFLGVLSKVKLSSEDNFLLRKTFKLYYWHVLNVVV